MSAGVEISEEVPRRVHSLLCPWLLSGEVRQLVIGGALVHLSGPCVERGAVAIPARVTVNSTGNAEASRGVTVIHVMLLPTVTTAIVRRFARRSKVSPLLTLHAAHWFPLALDNIEFHLAYDQLFGDSLVCGLWVSEGEYCMGNGLGEASVCWLNPSGGYNGVGLERIGGFDLPHVIWITSVEEERDEVDNYIVVTGPYRRRAC